MTNKEKKFLVGIVNNLGIISDLNFNIRDAIRIVLGERIDDFFSNEEVLKDERWLKTLVNYYKNYSDTELKKILKICDELEKVFSEFEI